MVLFSHATFPTETKRNDGKLFLTRTRIRLGKVRGLGVIAVSPCLCIHRSAGGNSDDYVDDSPNAERRWEKTFASFVGAQTRQRLKPNKWKMAKNLIAATWEVFLT